MIKIRHSLAFGFIDVIVPLLLIVKQGTEEEAASIKLLSKNLELADERIKKIGQSTSNQQKMNENVTAAIEQIKVIGTTVTRDVEDVALSLTTLRDEIELLKKGMESFKTGVRGIGREEG